MKEFGIDISRWQGDFNFDAAVNEGVKFAIVKGGGGDDGLYTDSKFVRNYTEAKNHNLPVGVYWFSKALTVAEGEKEADYFFNNVLNGRQFELPVYIDVENSTQLGVGKRLLTDIIMAWCNRLESKGYWVGVYSSLSYFGSYVYDNELTCYAHWVACWASDCSYDNADCFGMWQFGGETNKIRTNKVAGATCDQDYMLIDYPSKIKAAGLNGFGNTAAVPSLKSVDEVANEVLAGQWGNGDERKQHLTEAGYDYSAVQDAVNIKCGAASKPVLKSADEIASEVISGAWGNGSERTERLTAAGYDYDTIQDAVNAKLGASKPAPSKSITEVAKEVIRGDWGNGQDRKSRIEAAGYNYSEVQAKVNELL